MMKRIVSVFLTVAVFMLLLTGCSSNQSSVPSASTGSAESQKDDGEVITLSYMSWQQSATKASEEAAIANYMAEHPNIKIEAQFISGDDYLAKLNTLIAADSAPDIYMTNEFLTLQFGEEGLLEDLTPYYQKNGVNPAEKFVEGTAAISAGKCYGVGKDCASIMLFYNKPLFEKYGVELPPATVAEAWTWEEFLDAAKTLTIDANGNNAHSPNFDKNNVVTYGTVLDASGWLLDMPLLYSNGGSFAKDNGTASNLTSPETVEVYERLYELIDLGIAPTPAIKSGMPSGAAMMAADQVAMYWSGGWEVGSLKEGNIDFGVGLMPKFKDAVTVSWSAHYGVSSKTPYKQEAFDFVSWFVDPETNPLVLEQGVPSSADFMEKHPDALNDYYGEDNAKVILESLSSAVVPENITVKNFSQIADQQFRPAMEKVWYGEASVEDTLQEIEDACNAADLFQGCW